MKEILKFELFYKLLMNAILLPCLSLLTGWFLRYVIGDTVLYNFDMVYSLFSIPGILLVLAYVLIVILCVYFEYIVVYKLVYCFKTRQTIDWKNLSLSSLQDLSVLKTKYFPFFFYTMFCWTLYGILVLYLLFYPVFLYRLLLSMKL